MILRAFLGLTAFGALQFPATAQNDTAVTSSLESCDFGEPSPSAPEQFTQFEFLIGAWSVELRAWSDGSWSPPRPQHALWVGEYALGGMAIYDEWYDVDPAIATDTLRGANLRMFNPETEQWEMTWLHSRTFEPSDLTAEMRDGRLVMWQSHPEMAPWEAEFNVLSDDHWHRTQYTIDEDGNRSKLNRLEATRIPCEAMP